MPSDQPEPPIVIVGPTTRCGTSLLQRALNSTRKIVIYGENFTFMQKFPDMVHGSARNLNAKRRNIATSREMLRSGVDFEASALFPDYDAYIDTIRQGFHGIARLYRTDAKELGFDRWGLKHQVRDQRTFEVVPQLLPRARFIFIYRELIAVARSAKSRWPGDFKSEADYQRFGDNWARNIRTALDLESERFVVLRYEEFIADPEPFLRRIEAFTGIDGIDRSVMTRRINANPLIDADAKGKSPDSYREPADLSDRQRDLLMVEARPLHEGLGYSAA
ncbi:MAG: sulfotransferase [Dongiaceae bacterium]